MPARMILPLILGLLFLPVFPQDEPPPSTGDTSEVSDYAADLITKAEEGDASAQSVIGIAYEWGTIVAQDYEEAIRWYRAAAEQGDAFAQRRLGWLYYNGEVVPQDYKEAVRWYRAAAEQGDSSAQWSLGDMSYNGEGTP